MKVILFLSTLLVACALASWDAHQRDIQTELAKKWKSVDTVFCQSFPVLGPIPPNYEPLIALINQFASNISQIVAATGVPSVTVNLIYDQEILWTKGFGLKDLSNPSAGAPDGDTLYLIGSNTKLFTTLLALIAQEKGLLSFSDEVASHVPEFAPINPFPSKRSINFAQLASHMAGMQRESPCDILGGLCNLTNQVMWARLRNVTLINPPGAIPQYSNAGFAILGHATEEIMGGEWLDLVEQHILTPLGMNHSGSGLPEKFFAGRAVGYSTNNSVANLLKIGWESPAGAMYSSTNDMAQLLHFFFRDDVAYMEQPNQILDAQSIREWRQPRYINIDSTGFGIPWEIYESPKIYTKAGSVPGYLSFTLSVPELKLGMIILQSSDAVPAYSEIFSLWGYNFIPPFAAILQDLAPAPYIPPDIGTFVGSYFFAFSHTTVNITVVKTAQYPVIMMAMPNVLLTLKYISENVFKMSTQGVAMSCLEAQNGLEEYLIFAPTSPPTLTIPGLWPYQTGYKTA